MPGTLIFDVNETLSDLAPLDDVFAAIGLPAGTSTAWVAATLRDGFALSLTTGARSFPDVAEQVLRALLSGHAERVGTVDDGADRVMSTFSRLPVHDDVAAGVRALAADGHHMVTLSNGSAEYARDLLDRAHVADLFEAFLSVDDVGVWKPHRRPYEHALSRLSVDAADAAVVAVHPWDLHGARATGLTTVHVDRDATPWPTVFNEPDIRVGALTELDLSSWHELRAREHD